MSDPSHPADNFTKPDVVSLCYDRADQQKVVIKNELPIFVGLGSVGREQLRKLFGTANVNWIIGTEEEKSRFLVLSSSYECQGSF